MEGSLMKWTNAFTGWQARWYVLENGTLYCYKSEAMVPSGCGSTFSSMKLFACAVIVHARDSKRLDLMIPGRDPYYVKASTQEECRKWLRAFNTASLCWNDASTPTSTIKKRIEKTGEKEIKPPEMQEYYCHACSCTIELISTDPREKLACPKCETECLEEVTEKFRQEESRRKALKILKKVIMPVAICGAVAVGAVVTVVAAPAVLAAVGFTQAGIAAGSIAAGMMSSAAIANGGAIAADSTIALLQTAGAVGLGAAATAAVAGVGGAVGGAIGAGVAVGAIQHGDIKKKGEDEPPGDASGKGDDDPHNAPKEPEQNKDSQPNTQT